MTPATRASSSDANAATIAVERFDAVLLDLDGVVTETAALHAAAWKEALDQALAEWSRQRDGSTAPFDIDTDYHRHVDGKPREAGIRAFLQARGIELPDGKEADTAADLSVRGIANTKNAAYHRLMAERGVKVHDDALDFIKRVRAAGLVCAVVSSSRNVASVLAAADLEESFDLRVDGNDLVAENLAGKPAPDLFLLAARRAGVEPARAAVLEDALSGVEAGKAGGFGLVVGVARGNAAEDLRAHGADVALVDLRKLGVSGATKRLPEELPSALDALPELTAIAASRRLAVFLDYDGTLTPIVARPDLAVLSPEMRDVLRGLAKVCTVAVISGRDRADVAERVGVGDLIYAGSHGFDIAAPHGQRIEHEEGAAHRDELRAAAEELREALAEVPGAIVEEKRYGVAVHYRQVPPARQDAVNEAVDAAQRRHPRLARTLGKKVYEFRPGIPWDKGKAVDWLLSALDLSDTGVLAIYLGDDVTDEDAFAQLAESGIGILVGEGYGATRARYQLEDVEAVRAFLAALSEASATRRR
ncbi:trehalose-phosphatase [Ferruginivarius sediminum]|uniref:trehalose-phosphatase n=1 Tax=Ferruginivarius sediminum TaxID=2661937 RepID=UPI0019D43109|nr:trehalose-phosphatase [Ferruginivarius sediminum]